MIPEADTAPSLCVSVVVYRSDLARLGATLDCLAGAVERLAPQLSTCSVRVVDNASGPAYVHDLESLLERFARRFPSAPQLLHAPHNLGYGRGMNLALESVDTDLVLILNPDIEMHADALVQGLAVLDRERGAVAVAPRCADGEGRPESLCKRYPAVLDLLLRGFAPAWVQRRCAERLARYEYRDLEGCDAPVPVTLIGGACVLLRGSVFRRVGGFADAFFMYFEDFDLSLRAAGHGTLLYVPAMRVRHHGGNAARKGWRHILWFTRSAVRFYARHGWRWV